MRADSRLATTEWTAAPGQDDSETTKKQFHGRVCRKTMLPELPSPGWEQGPGGIGMWSLGVWPEDSPLGWQPSSLPQPCPCPRRVLWQHRVWLPPVPNPHALSPLSSPQIQSSKADVPGLETRDWVGRQQTNSSHREFPGHRASRSHDCSEPGQEPSAPWRPEPEQEALSQGRLLSSQGSSSSRKARPGLVSPRFPKGPAPQHCVGFSE